MSKKSKATSLAYPDDSWRARSDMSTLKEAEQIKSDKGRMAAAQREATKEVQALSRVAAAPSAAKRAAPAKYGNLAKRRI